MSAANLPESHAAAVACGGPPNEPVRIAGLRGGEATARAVLRTVGRGVYSLFFESIQMVTGPSFTSSIFMSAPKTPVAGVRPEALATASTKRQ